MTIIPLDKIVPRRVSSAAADRASGMAKDMNTTAHPAIELVGFEEEVRNAIEHVFGSTLVVDGMKAANSICDATKTRTVTLDGDVYEPSGLISGGSKDNLGSTLSKISQLTSRIQGAQGKDNTVGRRREQVAEHVVPVQQFEKLSGELEIATSELAAVEKHISQTSYGMLKDKFDAMTKEITDATEEVSRWRRRRTKSGPSTTS